MPDLTRTTVYMDAAKTKIQAAAWAKQIERKTGLRVAQPVSAYLRFLVAQDGKRRRR